MDKLKQEIRESVLEHLDLSKEVQDAEVQEVIYRIASAREDVKLLSIHQRRQMEKEVFDSLRKMDVLQELIEDPEISEIMVNGPNHIFYEKRGQIYQSTKKFLSEETLEDLVQSIVANHNRVVNQASPIVDTRLADGSRVNIVLSPISIDGTVITIRRFPKNPMQMQTLIQLAAITPEAARFLQILVEAKYNIFISGGTSSGKTTFLNALSNYIPQEERIITIEDSAELQIQGIPNLIRLETREANVEGVKAISMRDLIRAALRMRPNRIILGECRGEEALDMLQTMLSGHDGSLSTGHSNSCEDMLSRLETMVLMGATELPLHAVRQQIAAGIDVMIHLARTSSGKRLVMEITEITGCENGEIQKHFLYKRNKEGVLEKVGEMSNTQKLEQAGRKL